MSISPAAARAIKARLAKMKAQQTAVKRLPSRNTLEAGIEAQKQKARQFMKNYLQVPRGGKRKREAQAVKRIRIAQKKLLAAQQQLQTAKTAAEKNSARGEIRAQKKELVFYYGIGLVMVAEAPREWRRLVKETGLGNKILEEVRTQIFS
ncbi:MAG: hypothetical protein CL943_00820 [Candidatus Diapherotrites archaeon]|uniref:Uncharacterized protein n=1 Tax=Candidatus Iainarchaeum sp. TaxID=3101447 RepID=A0A2D6M087_9ARCH|nr:hypothetical protein [Candidatus Diapherotrites archaeon]